MTNFSPVSIPKDVDLLVDFLTNEEWPYHVNSRLSESKVKEMIKEGYFDGSNQESFWILNEEPRKIGFVRLFDLEDIDDGYPLFDLRLLSGFRGRGIGQEAVRWLTKYLFEKHPKLDRIIGTTRVDNLAMRKTFRRCGYLKEGHYRKDWMTITGEKFDTVKYGILRDDWLTGKSTPVNWNDEL